MWIENYNDATLIIINKNPINIYTSLNFLNVWAEFVSFLYSNNYISKTDLEFKNYPILIKERTQNFYEKADYYFEEIRKSLYQKYGQEKLYSDGLIVKTSINSKIQNIVDESLYNGLINYDKKKGWRGEIKNTDITTFKNYQNE